MLARPAALKLIQSQRVSGPAERSADVLRRFEREARATARLRSANTVELYDFGRTEAGDFYYVMELQPWPHASWRPGASWGQVSVW